MTTPLPDLLRRTEDYLSGLTDPTGMTAVRDDALAAAKLPGLLAEILAHPALAPLRQAQAAPAPESSAAPLPAIVLAKLICEINNSHKPFYREDGEQQWHTNCIAVQRLIFLAHGYHWAWYGQPLVDEGFEMFSHGPSLASLRALPGWKTCAEDAPAVMAADTSIVTNRQLAVVTEIVRAHGTWGMDIDRRVAKYPLVVAGDVSEEAIHRHFALQATGLNKKEFDDIGRQATRVEAVDALVDEATKAELLRRWLT